MKCNRCLWEWREKRRDVSECDVRCATHLHVVTYMRHWVATYHSNVSKWNFKTQRKLSQNIETITETNSLWIWKIITEFMCAVCVCAHSSYLYVWVKNIHVWSFWHIFILTCFSPRPTAASTVRKRIRTVFVFSNYAHTHSCAAKWKIMTVWVCL